MTDGVVSLEMTDGVVSLEITHGVVSLEITDGVVGGQEIPQNQLETVLDPRLWRGWLPEYRDVYSRKFH